MGRGTDMTVEEQISKFELTPQHVDTLAHTIGMTDIQYYVGDWSLKLTAAVRTGC